MTASHLAHLVDPDYLRTERCGEFQRHVLGRCRHCEKTDGLNRILILWVPGLMLRDAYCPACGCKLDQTSINLLKGDNIEIQEREPAISGWTP